MGIISQKVFLQTVGTSDIQFWGNKFWGSSSSTFWGVQIGCEKIDVVWKIRFFLPFSNFFSRFWRLFFSIFVIFVFFNTWCFQSRQILCSDIKSGDFEKHRVLKKTKIEKYKIIGIEKKISKLTKKSDFPKDLHFFAADLYPSKRRWGGPSNFFQPPTEISDESALWTKCINSTENSVAWLRDLLTFWWEGLSLNTWGHLLRSWHKIVQTPPLQGGGLVKFQTF